VRDERQKKIIASRCRWGRQVRKWAGIQVRLGVASNVNQGG
jgi:hypothetical protein